MRVPLKIYMSLLLLLLFIIKSNKNNITSNEKVISNNITCNKK